jgi:hypothetical protein
VDYVATALTAIIDTRKQLNTGTGGKVIFNLNPKISYETQLTLHAHVPRSARLPGSIPK